jgi:glycosyltransferase involved in cell wall biosynthesis
MRVLFIHQNIPGQFPHLMRALCDDPANEVWAIGEQAAAPRAARLHARLRVVSYAMGEPEAKPNPHPYLADVDAQVRRGQTVARALLKMKGQGLVPDVIVAHPGWGEALFVKDVFPHVPLLDYFEFYFSATGADVGFDPEFPSTLDNALRLRVRNAAFLSALDACDAGVSPTGWQRSRFPATYRDKIAVVHEGVDTAAHVPDAAATFEWEGRTFRAGEPVVTYVARNLEPYRGFHVFMRSLPRLLAAHPTAQVLVVGGDGVSYGRKAAQGRAWKRAMLDELGDAVDLTRVHFTGKLPFAQYQRVLQVSAAHVYLTYPFVLSWSLLEAMASGCLIVGSRTAPVEEVVVDGVNGRLVDFFDAEAITGTVLQALERPAAQRALRAAARETVVNRFDLARVCLPQGLELIRRVAGRGAGAG